MPQHTIHVFLSYTRREEEVQQFQRVTDAYCHLLKEWARTHGVDVFYDKSSISQDADYSDRELEAILRRAVLGSHLFVSFLSPEYINSRWCRFEYMTKWNNAVRQIHQVYWKPEIARPFFPGLARFFRPVRTRFLMQILGWNHITVDENLYPRGSGLMEFVLDDDPDNPGNFSDVTDVYTKGIDAGLRSIAHCAQKSAQILCREHSALFGKFRDHAFFNK
jgi:hypothetical protein